MILTIYKQEHEFLEAHVLRDADGYNSDRLITVAKSREGTEFKEGFTYLILIGRGASYAKMGLVRFRQGRLRNLIGRQQELAAFLGYAAVLEFPKHKIVLGEIPAPLYNLISREPENDHLLSVVFRQYGIPFPIGKATSWCLGEWTKYISSTELDVHPLALEFFRGLESGRLHYYDDASPQGPTPVRPGPIGQPVPGETRMISIEAERLEHGRSYFTRRSRWSGDVLVPVAVIREGEEAVEEFLDSYVQNLGGLAWVERDTDDGDSEISETQETVTNYGNLDEVVSRELEIMDDENEDDD